MSILHGAHVLLFGHPWIVAYLFGGPFAIAAALCLADSIWRAGPSDREDGHVTFAYLVQAGALLVLLVLAALAVRSSVAHG